MRRKKGHTGTKGMSAPLAGSASKPTFGRKAKKPGHDDPAGPKRPVAHAPVEAKKSARRKRLTGVMI